MKTIEDLIIKEFETAFKSILNRTTGLDAEFLLETAHSYILSELESFKGVKGVIEEERKDLLDFMILADELEDGTYDIKAEHKLRKVLEKYPLLSIRVFLFLYQVEGFAENGFTSDELTEFYKTVFRHPDLVNLENCFSLSKILIPIFLATEVPERLVELFYTSILNHPDKVMLKYALARIYEIRKDYDSAIDMNLQFIEQLKSTKVFDEKKDRHIFQGDGINDDEEYILSLTSLAESHFKIKQYDITLDFCKILQQMYDSDDQSIYSFQFLLVNPIMLKLRCYMMQNSIDDFKAEFNILKEKIDKVDLEQMDINDITEYSQTVMD